jgi:hypothetical protein
MRIRFSGSQKAQMAQRRERGQRLNAASRASRVLSDGFVAAVAPYGDARPDIGKLMKGAT